MAPAGQRKKPTKPPSGYNIFYACESKRTRGREKAEQAYFENVVQKSRSPSSSFVTQTSRNKTKRIGGKWKALRPNSRELFAIRSKEELESYHVDKMLWDVLDRATTSAENRDGSDKHHTRSATRMEKTKQPPSGSQQLDSINCGADANVLNQEDLFAEASLFFG